MAGEQQGDYRFFQEWSSRALKSRDRAQSVNDCDISTIEQVCLGDMPISSVFS